jgi:mRNA interferase MazF
MTHTKNFTDWFSIKPKLDSLSHRPPFLNEGQIWWCSLGENVGTEVSGKGRKFTRPAIILRKLSRHTYLVIPTSSKINQGSWYVEFLHKNKKMVACLHQSRVIDYRRVDNRIGDLDKYDFQKVVNGFRNLFCP